MRGSLEWDISSLRAFRLGGRQVLRVVCVSARAFSWISDPPMPNNNNKTGTVCGRNTWSGPGRPKAVIFLFLFASVCYLGTRHLPIEVRV